MHSKKQIFKSHKEMLLHFSVSLRYQKGFISTTSTMGTVPLFIDSITIYWGTPAKCQALCQVLGIPWLCIRVKYKHKLSKQQNKNAISTCDE